MPAPIPQPENSISITDSAYGAEDGQDGGAFGAKSSD